MAYPRGGSRPAACSPLRSLLLAALPLVLASRPLAADEARELELERELEEVKSRLERLEAAARRRPGAAGDDGPSEGERQDVPGVADVTPFWEREPLERPPALRGIYDKPFLLDLWERAHVGGYTELEYHSFEDGIQGIPEGFRMHRTNLFLFSEVSDRVRFASELEFETEFEGAEPSSEIEVAVEMAFIDWTLFEELTFRGGVILPPLGRINVNHDGPVREFTERPLVSTFVIPTTLSEPGVGLLGAFDIAEWLSLDYQAYAVNGFNVLDRDGELAAPITERESLLRESRTSLGGDINDGVAATGRIGVDVLDSFEAGASWHTGTYDARGDNFLRIFAGDFAWAYWIFSAEGEVAIADFERNAFARAAGVPERFWGYYVQASAGGMPEWLREAVPFLFGGTGAKFSVAVRYGWVDLDGDRGELIEPGFTFRPVADTVFKFSYRFMPNSFGIRGVPGREDWDDEGFVFSISTYF